jgi:hypothetical protein
LPVGVGRIMRNAPADRKVKVAILSIGTRLIEAMRAARMLVRVLSYSFAPGHASAACK